MAVDITVTKPVEDFDAIFTRIYFTKILPEFEKAEYDLMCQIRDDIVNKIKTNFFNLIRDYRYTKKKLDWGLGNTPLVATNQYINSIVVKKADPGWVVTIEDIRHETRHIARKGTIGGSLPMKTLAFYLEYGTENMPAMPHWRPTFLEWEEKKGTINDRFESALAKARLLQSVDWTNQELRTSTIQQ